MLINILHLSADKCIELGPQAIAAEEKRRQSYLEEMATQRAKFVVHDGFVDRPVFKGISKSHKQIVQYAKDNNLPSIVIMEDDCKFTHPDSYKYFLKNTPQDYDLYFGLIYHGSINEEYRVMNGFSGGLTLYRINRRFYDTFLSVSYKNHLDNQLGELAWNHKYYVCPEFCCTQPGGYSYNHRRELYYDEYLRNKVLYTGRH